MPRTERRRRYRHKRAAQRAAARRECMGRILFSVTISAGEAIKKLSRIQEATKYLAYFKAKLKEQ